MSSFDRYTVAQYVEGLRVFLRMKKRGFKREAGLLRDPGEKRRGRLPRYPADAIRVLELAANEKAASCEASNTTLGQRYRLGRDYKGMRDSQVARELGVSRELVRRWGEDLHRPSCMCQLAELLDIPLVWLEEGGERNLPASSQLGVRVGDEARFWRERLYGLELAVIAELPDDDSATRAHAYIESAVMTRPELTRAARRAGGRWQLVEGALLFAPWVPIREHGLSRRYWSDQVEAMIAEELASKPSIYSAWHSLRARCEAEGLCYPKLISLYKRVQTERERLQRYGLDLNGLALRPRPH